MKDTLKNFTVKKALNQLSEQTIDTLLHSKAGMPPDEIQNLHKTLRKGLFLEIASAKLQDSQEAFRILRTAFFFHQHKEKIPTLREYLASAGVAINPASLDGCKSDTDLVARLCLDHLLPVSAYFSICLHTCQSQRYITHRTDYPDTATSLPSVIGSLDTLISALTERMADGYGDIKPLPHHFEHQGKLFVIIEFSNTPTVTREFDGDKPKDCFRRFALDLTYVFDPASGTVDAIADTTELRQHMHQACAAATYGKEQIAPKQPKNEIFDLQCLMDRIIAGMPLTAPHSETGVRQILIKSVTVKRNKPPFWESTLKTVLPPKTGLSAQTDTTEDIRKLVISIVNTKDDPGGWWHKSYVELTRAELIALYYDTTEQKDMTKAFNIKNNGETNLGHDREDEAIKTFLREISLLKARPMECQITPNSPDYLHEHPASLVAEPV